MTIDEQIAAMQAFKRDGEVECRRRGAPPPWHRTDAPEWNFLNTDYRPIPKKPRWWWLTQGQGQRNPWAIAYPTLEAATLAAPANDRVEYIPVVEVLPEPQDEPKREPRFLYVNNASATWPSAHHTKDRADSEAGATRADCVLFREVMPGEPGYEN